MKSLNLNLFGGLTGWGDQGPAVIRFVAEEDDLGCYVESGQ